MNERITRGGWGSGRAGSAPDGRFVSQVPDAPYVVQADETAVAGSGHQPDIVFIVKKDATILYLNRTVAGAAEGGPIGQSLLDFVGREHHQAARSSLERAFADSEARGFECRGTSPFVDGAWYHCRIAPNQRDGDVVSATVIARDVSRWKHSEEHLKNEIAQLQREVKDVKAEKTEFSDLLAQHERREHELNRFRRILDQAGEAIFLTDPKTGRFVDANETACQWLGLSRDKLLTLSVRDLDLEFPIESPDGIGDHVTDTRDANRPRIFDEGNHRRRNGTTFPVEVAIAHRRFGDRDYTLVVARDIKRRRVTERMVKESEDKYHTLFDLSRDAIYCTARDGTIEDANSAAIDLFGYNRAELLGLEAKRLYVNAEDIRAFQRAVDEAGSVKDLTVDLRDKNGKLFRALLTATLRRDGEGNIQGYQCILCPSNDGRSSQPTPQVEVEEPVSESRQTVMVIGGNKWVIDEVRRVLERADIDVLSARTDAAALQILSSEAGEIGAVLIDAVGSPSETQATLAGIRQASPGLPIILMADVGIQQAAGVAIDFGSDAVIQKPLHPLAIVQNVREALESWRPA